MHNTPRYLLFVIMILIVSTSLVACQSSPPAQFGGVPTPDINVYITGNICPSLIVNVGDQITWTNQDQRVHLVHIESSDGKNVFDSGVLQPGDTASTTLLKPGDYVYVCTSDPESTGTITVEP